MYVCVFLNFFVLFLLTSITALSGWSLSCCIYFQSLLKSFNHDNVCPSSSSFQLSPLHHRPSFSIPSHLSNKHRGWECTPESSAENHAVQILVIMSFPSAHPGCTTLSPCLLLRCSPHFSWSSTSCWQRHSSAPGERRLRVRSAHLLHCYRLLFFCISLIALLSRFCQHLSPHLLHLIHALSQFWIRWIRVAAWLKRKSRGTRKSKNKSLLLPSRHLAPSVPLQLIFPFSVFPLHSSQLPLHHRLFIIDLSFLYPVSDWTEKKNLNIFPKEEHRSQSIPPLLSSTPGAHRL